MPLLTLQADPDQDPEKLHALIRRAQAQSTDPVLVVYKRRTARIYFEREKPPPAEKPRS
jgi:hypothetical protein